MPRSAREILGVGPGASADDIRKAFRALAALHHPDRNPGNLESERKFREISAAYTELMDDAGRSARGFPWERAPGGWRPDNAASAFDFVGEFLGDLFGSILGAPPSTARRPGGAHARGEDVRMDLSLTPTEALTGASKPLSFTKKCKCPNCAGAGAVRDTASRSCRSCDGQGAVSHRVAILLITKTCAECGGRGSIPDDPCIVCQGLGLTIAPSMIRVQVPAGVRDSSRLRFSGQGNQVAGDGPAGDLLVDVHIAH